MSFSWFVWKRLSFEGSQVGWIMKEHSEFQWLYQATSHVASILRMHWTPHIWGSICQRLASLDVEQWNRWNSERSLNQAWLPRFNQSIMKKHPNIQIFSHIVKYFNYCNMQLLLHRNLHSLKEINICLTSSTTSAILFSVSSGTCSNAGTLCYIIENQEKICHVPLKYSSIYKTRPFFQKLSCDPSQISQQYWFGD